MINKDEIDNNQYKEQTLVIIFIMLLFKDKSITIENKIDLIKKEIKKYKKYIKDGNDYFNYSFEFYENYIDKKLISFMFNGVYKSFSNGTYEFYQILEFTKEPINKIYKEIITNIKTQDNYINEFLKKEEFFFLPTCQEVNILANTIFILESKEYSDLNISGYNFFEKRSYLTFFNNFDFFHSVELIFNDRKIFLNLLYRFCFFINNQKFEDNLIFLIQYDPKFYNQIKPAYILLEDNVLDYDIYIKTKSIVKLSEKKYLLRIKEENIKEKNMKEESKEFFDLSLNNDILLKLENKSKQDFYKKFKLKDINYPQINNYLYEHNQEDNILKKIEKKHIYLNYVFKKEEKQEIEYYKNLLSLEDKKDFNEIKKDFNTIFEKNTEYLYDFLNKFDFFSRVLKFEEQELFYSGIYLPNRSSSYSYYKKFEKKILLFIQEYYNKKYEEKKINSFCNLFTLYFIYNNIQCNSLFFNITIIEEIDKYINYCSYIDFNKKHQLKNLFNYIKNENDEITKFLQTLNRL